MCGIAHIGKFLGELIFAAIQAAIVREPLWEGFRTKGRSREDSGLLLFCVNIPANSFTCAN